MKRTSIEYIVPLLITALSISVAVTLVKAQPATGGQSLEVSPPSQEIPAKPGTTIQVKAKIRNVSQTSLPLAVRLGDFVASGNEGQVALTEKGPWAITSWATLSPTNFQLAAGETKEVTATIAVPAGTAGGRYGAFIFSVSGKAEAGKAALSQEVASLFLLDIAGPRDENMTITSFAAPEFSEFGPVPFTLSLKNAGNVHLKAAGVIAVTDMFGKKVIDIPVAGTNVFPGSERQVKASWEQKLLIGRYTAQAIIASGGMTNKTLIATTTFTVFPIRIAAIIVLIIVFLFLMRNRLSRAGKALAGK